MRVWEPGPPRRKPFLLISVFTVRLLTLSPQLCSGSKAQEVRPAFLSWRRSTITWCSVTENSGYKPFDDKRVPFEMHNCCVCNSGTESDLSPCYSLWPKDQQQESHLGACEKRRSAGPPQSQDVPFNKTPKICVQISLTSTALGSFRSSHSSEESRLAQEHSYVNSGVRGMLIHSHGLRTAV